MTTAFASLIDRLVSHEGSNAKFAAKVGKSERAVRAWKAGNEVPYIATLLDIADRCSVGRDVVLHAAGKPSSTELRELLCQQPEATLAIQLGRYRASRNLDTEAAAAIFGVDRWKFSRLANGTMVVRSLKLAGRIGRGLGVSPVDVLRASGHDDTSPLLTSAIEATSGFAGWLRDGIENEGKDSFEPATLDNVASSSRMSSYRLKRMLFGQKLPDLIEAQRINRRFGFDLADVLSRSGWEQATATRIVDAVSDVDSPSSSEPLGAVLRSYRTAAGLSTIETAQCVGLACHSTVSRWESGQRMPSPQSLIDFSDLTGAPLSHLLGAARMLD